jgi:hypothetical protein
MDVNECHQNFIVPNSKTGGQRWKGVFYFLRPERNKTCGESHVTDSTESNYDFNVNGIRDSRYDKHLFPLRI